MWFIEMLYDMGSICIGRVNYRKPSKPVTKQMDGRFGL